MRDLKGYDICVDFLLREFRFRDYESRASIAIFPLPTAKKLAHLLLVQGIRPHELQLREVHTFSSYLSRQWREKLECVFGARIVDHYGFSEVMEFKAHECLSCGYYHATPHHIVELVDSTGSPLAGSASVGRILVTRLLEESDNLQPVLRYDSGDLGELGSVCAQTGEQGFKPLGKLAHSIRVNSKDGLDLYPVIYADILEAIDCDPSVARIANTRQSLITPTEGDSFAKWRLRRVDENDSSLEILVEIEMNYDSRLFPSAWGAFEERVGRKLAQNSDLSSALAENLTSLRIVGLPPGSLRDSDVMRS